MRDNGMLHFLIGPVGAGKTTTARALSLRSGGLLLDCDEWMVRLFGADTRPSQGVLDWYLERRERCRSLLWDTALSLARTNTPVYLELGLILADERALYFSRATDAGIHFQVLLVSAPRELRRRRVMERNAACDKNTQMVPPEFFERASDHWQEPSEQERLSWNIIDT